MRAVFDALDRRGIRYRSEPRLRDCAQLLRVNADTVDSAYLELWAKRLGVAQRLRDVS